MSGIRKTLVIVIAVFFGALTLGALALASFDWNLARGWIAAQLKSRTGRDLTIDGNLSVHPFSFNPRVSAERVTLGNAEWGERRPMLTAERIEFSVSLARLMEGRIVFPEVSLRAPAVLLERDREGRRNWILNPAEEKTGASPQIVRLQVDAGQLEFRDEISNTALKSRVNTVDGEKYGVAFTVAGRAAGIPLTARGMGGALLTLLDENTPYPIRVQATVGATSIDAEGIVHGIATLNAVDAKFTIAGKNLALLSDPLHIALPPTAPYRLAGHLSRRGSVWQFERFRGTVGGSDLAGNFSVDTSQARPLLRGTLTSSLLNVADLGGFVGAGPGAEASAVPGRVLPQASFDLEKLRRVDADVNLSARRFTNRDTLPLDDLKARLTLKDGVVQLAPINFGVAGGHMRSIVRLDARQSRIQASAETAFQRLHINLLVPRAEILESALGTIDGNARLAGSGNSVADMLGSANGQVALVSAGGNISNLLLAFAGANGAKILQLLVLGDREAALHCGAVAFHVKQGLMSSDVMVVDTSDTSIVGEGNISLRDETLNLTLHPMPKKPSLLSLRGPLHLTGTFHDPGIQLDKPTISLRAGGALLLGLINPLAALLPLIETGPGKDSDCGRLATSLSAAARETEQATAGPRRMRGG